MKTYYVNAVSDYKLCDTDYGTEIIGLFDEHGFKGCGNFCGWYSSEWYLNTKLYAHYLADCSGLYRPEKRISEITIHDPAIEYDAVQIGSCYWETKIEAETLEEAIEKFKNADWHK